MELLSVRIPPFSEMRNRISHWSSLQPGDQLVPPGTDSPAHSPAVAALTVPIDGKGHICGDNLVVADLAVLWGAVLVYGFHLQNAVIDLPLCH